MIGPNFFILWLIVGALAAICVVILGLMFWAVLRSKVRSPSAQGATPHQDAPDFFWTVAPLLAFAIVSAPLLRLTYMKNAIRPADLTIRVTARMWYWTYEYSGRGNFSFVAPMLANSAIKVPATDPPSAKYDHIVVPVAKTVRIVGVATNVIYSWAIPSIGAKIEALPGQLNQNWFVAMKEGRYYGECSDLCGLPHEFRPIEVEVVSQKRFDMWAAEAREKLASAAHAEPQTQ
jgi:cytochrome c oxidase subunit 2